jgi:hypothetical protein
MTSLDDCEFLKRICEGYVRCYRTLNLNLLHNNATDFTKRELSFFSDLGERLGYISLMEADSRSDLGWYIPDQQRVLHLERETNADRGGFSRPLAKLLPSTAKYRIAVLGWVRDEDVTGIEKQVLGQDNMMIIAWVGPDWKKPGYLLALIAASEKFWS